MPNGTQHFEQASWSATPAGGPAMLAGSPSWSYKTVNESTLSGGTATFYLRVRENTQNMGVEGRFCTWRLGLEIAGTNMFPNGGPCAFERAGPISGDRKVEIPFTLDDVKVKEGKTIVVTFISFTSSTESNPAVFVLSGSKDFPSGLQLTGLNETLPAA